jgi:3-hydroxymyristoyl/3-hydroxydecanoyl-(acyl carrier protein) dehydratase
MDPHFRAFSFVDRVTSFESGNRIRGEYVIPSGLDGFTASLVAEAVGQLAAWAAMATVDFKRRPVAGLAGEIVLLHPVRPGQRLELAADLEAVDLDAASYAGTAHADGIPVLRLCHCVGPMLAVDYFDDPAALRARFDLLCKEGAAPGGFGGVPALPLERIENEADQRAIAILRVPDQGDFFADHFPRRPVFPGSLLINASMKLAAALAGEIPAPAAGGSWAPRVISDVKLRAFTPPGAVLEIEARLNQVSTDAATMSVEARKGKRVISGARVGFAPEDRA